MATPALRPPALLRALRSTGLLEPEPHEALDRLTRLAVQAVRVPAAFLSLVDGDRFVLKSVAAPPGVQPAREVPLAHPFCRQAAASNEPFVVEDAREHPLAQGLPPEHRDRVVAYLGVPLRSHDGYALGAFCVVDDIPRVWSDAELALMSDLAAAAASEIELRRTTELARLGERRLMQAQALAGIGTWEWDVCSEATSWSRRTYEIMGVDPAAPALAHDDFMARVDPHDRARVEAVIQTALAGERPWYEYECRIRRADGEPRTISVRADMEYDPDGRPRRSVGIVRDVTVERATERELADAARMLAEAQELAGMGSWEWHADEDRTVWSDELYRIMGLEPGSVAASHEEAVARVHPDDRDEYDCVTTEAHVRGLPSYQVACRIVRPDGGVRWLHTRAWLTVDKRGRAVRTRGIVHDVTEARLAASRLAQAEANAGFGTWEWDLARGRATWSPPLHEIFGSDPGGGPLSYATVLGMVHPEDRDRADEETRAGLAGERPLDVTARIVRPDGETRWVRARAERMSDDSGGLVRLVGTMQDVTAAHRAQALLLEAEERFGTAFDSATSGMALVDAELRRFLRVNRALCEGLGHSEREVLAMDPIALLHPDDAAAGARELDELFAGERATLELEQRFVRPDGEVRVVLMHLAVVRGADDRPLYVVCQMRDMTAQRHAEEQVRFQSLHHPLTELPNRTLLLDRLRHALLRASRRGSTVVVLAVDLDRFQAVNERFGLAAGDQVLKEIGPRLSDGVREADTVAHLSEDLFAIVCEDVVDDHEAVELAARLQRAVRRPFELGGEHLQLTASVGVALAVNGEGAPEDLVRDAESAARSARERGGGAWEVFDPALRSRLVERLELEHQLRRGIERSELRLHYQPIVCSDKHEVLGYEALVRWEHPERGLLLPAEFLPIAEETGLDVALGSWVLREACRQGVAWMKADPDRENLDVSINVSARQVDTPGFTEEVAAALAETGIRPSRLRLELTETDLMRSADPVGTVEQLAALGVHVILDDFGTGYSSLAHLRRLPVHGLKVDRSFVADVDTDAQSAQIVEAIVAMADALDLTVVAEGVETERQLARLVELDCRTVQGYLFGRPCPAEELQGKPSRRAGVKRA